MDLVDWVLIRRFYRNPFSRSMVSFRLFLRKMIPLRDRYNRRHRPSEADVTYIPYQIPLKMMAAASVRFHHLV